jgi:hypothetical protein
MTIDATCKCGKHFQLPERFAGKRIRCNACAQALQIPSLAACAQPPCNGPGNGLVGSKRRPSWSWIAVAACFPIGAVLGASTVLTTWRGPSAEKNDSQEIAQDKRFERPESRSQPSMSTTSEEKLTTRPGKDVLSPPKEKPVTDPPLTKKDQQSVPLTTPDQPPPKEKPTEPRPADKPQDKVDQAIRLLIGEKSKKYEEDGYRKYNFGMTDEEINAKTPLKVSPRSPSLRNDEGEEFLFHEHTLVGVAKTYKGDNTGYLEKLKELFGTVRQEDVLEWQITNVNAVRGEPLVEAVGDAFYFFPKTLAVVRVVKSKIVIGDGKQYRDEEKVVVLVLSRSWASAVLRDDLNRKRESFDWIKQALEIARQNNLDQSKLPALRGTVVKEEMNKTRAAVAFFDEKLYDQKLDSLKSVWAAPTCVMDKFNVDSRPSKRKKGSVGVVFNFNRSNPAAPFLDRYPTGMVRTASRNPLLLTAFSELVGVANVLVAQEHFPATAQVVIFNRGEEGLKRYQWQTKDGWQVVIQSNDSVIITQVDNDL